MLRLFVLAVLLCVCWTSPGEAGEGRRIAITFDDAPTGDGPVFTGEERTRELLRALAAAEVEGAMFFVTTQNIGKAEKGAERLAAYVAAGHMLGNHSHSHQWLWKSDPQAYLADVERAASILAKFDGATPFFRYPFLDEGRTREARDAVRTWLSDNGIRSGYVTIDNYDWYMDALFAEASKKGETVDRGALQEAYVDILLKGAEFYDDLAREALGRSPAHVLLLHENDLAALFVDDLVRAFRARGWEIISAEEAYRDPIAELLPDTLFNGQGRVAAIAHAKKLRPARDMVSPFESEEWLRNEFARRGLLATD